MNTQPLRLIRSLILLGLLLLSVAQASAGPYFNSSEPGCDGSDPSVLWCDDFENGNWAQTYGETANPVNDGWNMTPFPPGGCPAVGGICTAGVALVGTPTNGAVCGSVGAVGTNCTASSGAHVDIGQAYFMGDHNLSGLDTHNEIYFRYYIKKIGPFIAGGEKHLTFNIFAGSGGIKFANLSSGGSGPDLIPPQGSGIHSEQMLIPAEGVNRDANIAPWNWIADTWFYLEVHLKLNTPGVSNGVYELWLDNCGPTGKTCPSTPTLRSQHTNVKFRNAGDNSQIGSIWLENWANPATSGVTFYDQIKVATKRVGPMNWMAPPSNLRVQ